MDSRLTSAFLILLLLLQTGQHILLLQKYYFGDEGSYLAMAKLVSQGSVLYTEIKDYHSPGVPLVGAVLFGLAGPSFDLARLLVLGVQLLTSIAIFLLGKRMFSEEAALVAVAVYALTEPLVLVGGAWFVAEPFVALFSLLAFIPAYDYFFRPKEARGELGLVASGVMAGLAAAFKQPGGAILFFLLALILLNGLRKRLSIVGMVRPASLVAAGFALPWLVLSAYFLSLGALDGMVYWLVVFPLFVKGSRDAGFFFESELGLMALFAMVLVVAAMCIRVLKALHLTNKDERFYTDLAGLGFIAAAALTAVPRFNIFHLMGAMPMVAVFAGDIISRRFPLNVRGLMDVFETIAAFTVIFASSLFIAVTLPAIQGVDPPDKIPRVIEPYLGERVQALPFYSFIYFYSNSRPASGYLSLDPVWITPEIDREVWDAVRANNATVVYAAYPLNGHCLPEYAPVLVAGLKANYVVVARPENHTFVLKPGNVPSGLEEEAWSICARDLERARSGQNG